MTEYHFFWNGPFSQWKRSDFEFGGITFSHAEQFMMFCKAVLFNDFGTAGKVLQADNPKEQKRLGRSVRNFDANKWNDVARDIVYVGNVCKFRDNENLKSILLETGDSVLVEASPYDKIWGIGMSKFDDGVEDQANWKGKNWLGFVLTRVRDDIRKHRADQDSFAVVSDLVKHYRDPSHESILV